MDSDLTKNCCLPPLAVISCVITALIVQLYKKATREFTLATS